MVLSITTPNSAGNQKVIRVQSPSGTHNSDTAHLHTAQRTFPCYSCAIITNRNINGWCTHCRYRESIHAGFSPTKGLRQYTNLFIFRFVYFNTAYAVDKVSCTVRLLTCIGLHKNAFTCFLTLFAVWCLANRPKFIPWRFCFPVSYLYPTARRSSNSLHYETNTYNDDMKLGTRLVDLIRECFSGNCVTAVKIKPSDDITYMNPLMTAGEC